MNYKIWNLGIGIWNLIIGLSMILTNPAFSQSDNSNPIEHALSAPLSKSSVQQEVTDHGGQNSTESYSSRFFAQMISPGIQMIKSFVNTPGSFTLFGGSTSPHFGGAFANGSYYALLHVSPGQGYLVKIDTLNGYDTFIGSLSGLASGHTVSGLAFDKTTGIMYASSTNASVGNLYTVNLTTGALTAVGAMNPMTCPIEIAINKAGAVYSWDVNSNALYSINKSSGSATMIGPLGIDILYAQGGGFDPQTDSLFLAAFIPVPFPGSSGLYRCNTNTGAVTSIGNFGLYNGFVTEVDAFIIVPTPIVTVSGAVSGNGNYNNLSEAFTAINSGPQTGSNITITIFSNTTEPSGGAILNSNSYPWTSLNIIPSGARTISGNVSAPMINLSGADNVRIDGLNSGGNSLTITNLNTSASSSTIEFTSNSINNVVTNCTILGSSASFNSGTVVFRTGNLFGGNNNNTISNCNIGPAGSLPANGILSLGNYQANTGNVISNCNIYDYWSGSEPSCGIRISSWSTDFRIENNRFYKAASVYLNNVEHSAIKIENTSGNNFLISGNTIGFSSSSGTGSYHLSCYPGSSFIPVNLSVGSAVVTGNTISGISLAGDFFGSDTYAPLQCINVKNGLVNITNNVIGTTGTPNINISTAGNLFNCEIYGIYVRNNPGNISISNNTIAGITGNTSGGYKIIRGIRYNSSSLSAYVSCADNTIGGTSVNSIYGSGEATGIYIQGSGCKAISKNTIKNLNSSITIAGINIPSGTGKNLIEGNFIHSVNLTGSDTAYGIYIRGDTNICQNNMIQISGPGQIIYGIKEAGRTNSIFFNSVYVGGSITNNYNSFAFFSSNTGSSTIRNNIFYNARSSQAKNYAIGVNFDTSVISTNNILYSTGAGNVLGLYQNTDITSLALWKSSTGLDSNSFFQNPQYIDPAGSTPNLHITNSSATPVEGTGTYISSIAADYDGQQRTSLSPVDIGADAGNFVSMSLTLNLKMFIEGFYSSTSNLQVSDTVKIYLRNSVSPYALIDSAEAVVSDSGISLLTFSSSATGSYYIILTHRNSIGTWSADAVAMKKGITVNYDFTNAVLKAFDDNMKQVDSSPAGFAIYSGDVNQDGAVDLADITDVYNSSVAFVTGYVSTDVNGDNTVDLSDITLTYNNSVNFVLVRRPV